MGVLMTWTCRCGTSNDGEFCRHCGAHQTITLSRVDDAGTSWLLAASAALAIALVGALIAAFLGPKSGQSVRHPEAEGRSAPAQNTAPPVATDPHEQRIADLRKERESLDWRLAVEREHGGRLRGTR